MYRPSSRRLRRFAPRILAAAWLWLFTSLWALLPALDARLVHPSGRSASAVVVDQSQGRTDGALVLGDSCELCDLLHSCGGVPVGLAAVACETDPVAAPSGGASAPSFATAHRLALARAPPAV